MYFQILAVLCFLISPVIRAEAQNDFRELKIVRNIVFMRTEGLGMIELLAKHCTDKRIQKICVRAKRYYTDTQPAMLELCRGMDLQLSKGDMQNVLGILERSFKNYNPKRDLEYLRICEEHVNRSIKIYTSLVQQGRWQNVSYFSFKALPELFNLQQEIRKIINPI